MANGKGKGVLLIAIGAALALGAGGKPAKAKGRPPIVIELPPIPEDRTTIDIAICDCSEELRGFTGDVPGALLECVAAKLFPQLPWPPIEADHESVHVWWDFLATQIVIYLEDPEAFCAFRGPPEGEPVEFDYGPATLPGYPYEIPRIHHGQNDKHYPTPGTFYILDADNASIGLPTNMNDIAWGALGSALAMGGGDVSLRDDAALRAQMKDLIVCSPWNDALYGTTNQNAAGGLLAMGPHGRGLTWRARHKNNLDLLAQGRPPERNVDLEGAKIGQGSRNMQIWIPAVNLEEVAKETPRVTVEGMTWSNGDSTLNPPPAVAVYGVESPGIEPPGGQFWGCE